MGSVESDKEDPSSVIHTSEISLADISSTNAADHVSSHKDESKISPEGSEALDDTDDPEEDKSDSTANLLEGHTSTEEAKLSSADDSPVTVPDDSRDSDKQDDGPGPKFPWPSPDSHAKKDWEYQKTTWETDNTALDELMGMIALESVKRKFVQMNTFIETAESRQKLSLSKEMFGAIFIGNPGTGKSTVAKIYADFLRLKDLTQGEGLMKISGAQLVAGGTPKFFELVQDLSEKKAEGALLVDDAHHLVSTGVTGNSPILDLLLSLAEELKGQVVFIFAGYGKAMESFGAHNPSFSNLIPTSINFPDYLDHELHLLLVHEMKTRFKNQAKIKGDNGRGGYYGLYMRALARRIGRSRGRYGFGNARDVQNTLVRVHKRQTDRLFQSMKNGTHDKDDDFIFTREDLLGPRPSKALTCSAWQQLKKMVGLDAVKKTIEALIHQLEMNYDRELAEKPLIACSLNKLFLGNPGTGKTTVAKLYGQILADIGLLSNGEVVVKTPSDFIGDALGQSESKTRDLLTSTKGKVLIIDEAYMLGNSGGSQYTSSVDPYRTAVIDTIVGEVQSTAVEDRCVLLLGYEERMESMLNEGNQALARRFPLASAFVFKDYSAEELGQILDLKLGDQGFRLGDDARDIALEILERARNRPGFGNAGEVDILLDSAKVSQHQRLLKKDEGDGVNKQPDLLLPEDFDPGRFEGATPSMLDVKDLFDDFVGCNDLVGRLEGYQNIVKAMRERAKDDDEESTRKRKSPRDVIPFTFLFCGPPGTGKTTTARRMGELFYDMRFLATKTVVERSATDLIGEYVGHTGPKTRRLFDSALGRVLFIDEAYKLAEGSYGREAMIEIINNLTKDKYRNKLVVILAGYDRDINKLMSINPGLKSRFPEVIVFKNLSAQHCIHLLLKCLEAYDLDIALLETSSSFSSSLERAFAKFSALPSWGNARDVHTLADRVFRNMMNTPGTRDTWIVPEDLVLDEVNSMFGDRQSREPTEFGRSTTQTSPNASGPLGHSDLLKTMIASPPPSVLTKMNMNVQTQLASRRNPWQEELEKIEVIEEIASQDDEDSEPASQPASPHPEKVERDDGVSDETWSQLDADKKAALQRNKALRNSRNILKSFAGRITDIQARISSAGPGLDISRFQKALEEAQDIHAKQKEDVDKREAEREEEGEMRKQLARKCPQGYYWVRQSYGYRCEGGTHYASLEQIMSGEIPEYRPSYSSSSWGYDYDDYGSYY